jgi:hypothetical protein
MFYILDSNQCVGRSAQLAGFDGRAGLKYVNNQGASMSLHVDGLSIPCYDGCMPNLQVMEASYR